MMQPNPQDKPQQPNILFGMKELKDQIKGLKNKDPRDIFNQKGLLDTNKLLSTTMSKLTKAIVDLNKMNKPAVVKKEKLDVQMLKELKDINKIETNTLKELKHGFVEKLGGIFSKVFDIGKILALGAGALWLLTTSNKFIEPIREGIFGFVKTVGGWIKDGFDWWWDKGGGKDWVETDIPNFLGNAFDSFTNWMYTKGVPALESAAEFIVTTIVNFLKNGENWKTMGGLAKKTGEAALDHPLIAGAVGLYLAPKIFKAYKGIKGFVKGGIDLGKGILGKGAQVGEEALAATETVGKASLSLSEEFAKQFGTKAAVGTTLKSAGLVTKATNIVGWMMVLNDWINGKAGTSEDTSYNLKSFVNSTQQLTEATNKNTEVTKADTNVTNSSGSNFVEKSSGNFGTTSRKGIYDSYILDAANKYGIDPLIIKAMIAQESGGHSYLTSNAGAGGLMQLMPETAQRFGVSDVYDPKQNVEGGTAYMAWLLKQPYIKGDMDSAIAAYNMGEGNFKKLRKRYGDDWKANLGSPIGNVGLKARMERAGYLPGVKSYEQRILSGEDVFGGGSTATVDATRVAATNKTSKKGAISNLIGSGLDAMIKTVVGARYALEQNMPGMTEESIRANLPSQYLPDTTEDTDENQVQKTSITEESTTRLGEAFENALKNIMSGNNNPTMYIMPNSRS